MEITSFLNPALTTINSPSKHMGEHTAEYLVKQIKNKSLEIERTELTAELIVRETTEKAPKS